MSKRIEAMNETRWIDDGMNAAKEASARWMAKEAARERAVVKIAAEMRITVEEFEALTGIMFSHNMSGKMEGILSISTSCTLNPICRKRMQDGDSICSECFSVDTQGNYKALYENMCLNAIKLSETVLDKKVIPFIPADITRIESFGDVQNVNQAINYINMCYMNPHCSFTAWTKNLAIWLTAFRKVGKPKNLIFGVSSSKKNIVEKIVQSAVRYVDFVFTVYELDWLLKNGINPETFINCGGRLCRGCMNCYTPENFSEDKIVYVNELLKADAKRAIKMGYNV